MRILAYIEEGILFVSLDGWRESEPCGTVPCKACDGKGSTEEDCDECSGSGDIYNSRYGYADCPYCDARGTIDVDCDECEATGIVPGVPPLSLAHAIRQIARRYCLTHQVSDTEIVRALAAEIRTYGIAQVAA